jgi:hypothetical protein
MANLKLYYSTGNENTREFDGQPKKSIGGIRTTQQLPSGGLSSLFGTVSARMLSEGITDYRGFYINSAAALTLLSVYADVPVVHSSTTPPSTPTLGDKYIVPTAAVDAWLGKDGKQATWSGTAWVFTFAPFAQFAFGFQTPTNIDIIESSAIVTMTDGYVSQLETIFNFPIGVDFFTADGLANKIAIGDGVFNSNEWLYVWIRRSVNKTIIDLDDLTVNEGGIVAQDDVPIVFTYDY